MAWSYLPWSGTSADIFAASWFAHRNNMTAALNICVGSGHPARAGGCAAFGPYLGVHGKTDELRVRQSAISFAIASTAFVVNAIARDGETTWFEGLLLVGVYMLFGLGFFFIGPA
ncbi:hypothetical protein [Bradyrhizobium sp. USDA 3650]